MCMKNTKGTCGVPCWGKCPLQALDLVDASTRKQLVQAKNAAEIGAILDGPSVVWQSHARCLRHPMKAGGCELPLNADFDSMFGE